MSSSTPTVKCAGCGLKLDEEAVPVAQRSPCPECGSTARMFEMRLSGSVSFKSKVAAKARNPKPGKPFHEQVTGDDLFKLTGQWNKLRRIIDRARDYYFELITDPKTGKVIRYCEEPLSKHWGRGSAKTKSGATDV